MRGDLTVIPFAISVRDSKSIAQRDVTQKHLPMNVFVLAV
jgi:hypothetical protein